MIILNGPYWCELYSISAHAVAYKSLFLDSDTTFAGLIRSQ